MPIFTDRFVPNRAQRRWHTPAAALLGLAIACAPAVRQSQTERTYPSRLVLALDGVDYRDVDAARNAGMFTAFRPPSRLVSTFPSISDIAWHDIFGVLPPRGYQRIYYSSGLNTMIGGPIDAIRPIEFEDRMDFAFGGKFHHLGAYIISATVARDEIDDTAEQLMEVHDRRTVYAYNVGPDALQHTRGDVASYLRHVDARLAMLMQEYRERTGRDLEIALLSDHGHNRDSDAKFLPLVDALGLHGFRATKQLRAARDVAFSVDGVTTGFGIFVAEPMVDSLARLLVTIEGVDVVTAVASPSRIVVRSDTAAAFIDHEVRNGVRFLRYTPERGDPLRLAPSIADMRRTRAMDARGYANADAWLRHTAHSQYPAAVPRIVSGHNGTTLNPAPILVSVASGWRVGLGMVSVANRLRPLGGTHGALDSSNSLGVLMTNFVDTRDDLTATVRTQLGGFDDLRDPFTVRSQIRLSSKAMLHGDRFHPLRAVAAADSDDTMLEVSIGERDATWVDERLAVFTELRRYDRNRGVDVVVGGARTAAADWIRTANGRRLMAPVSRLAMTNLEPSSLYSIRVRLALLRNGDMYARPKRSRELPILVVRTDARGNLLAF